MTGPLVTPNRDALAKALYGIECPGHLDWDRAPDLVQEIYLGRADALLASGAVIDAATLADDEALVGRLGYDLVDANADIADRMPPRGVFDEAEADAAVVLCALATALIEREVEK